MKELIQINVNIMDVLVITEFSERERGSAALDNDRMNNYQRVICSRRNLSGFNPHLDQRFYYSLVWEHFHTCASARARVPGKPIKLCPE